MLIGPLAGSLLVGLGEVVAHGGQPAHGVRQAVKLIRPLRQGHLPRKPRLSSAASESCCCFLSEVAGYRGRLWRKLPIVP